MSKKLRILIIEDSQDDALLLIRELNQGGYQPEYERVDTSDAMNSALETGKWDLIISDYIMPHFDGLEALKLLKKKDIDIPFILVSGRIGEDVAVDAMKAGAQDYVRKDDMRRLIPAIGRELSEVQVRQKRKLAEEALKESESRFRQLTESLPQLFWTCVPEGQCDYLSKQWIEYTGVPEKEQLGFGWLSQLYPDDRDQTIKAWNEALGKNTNFDVEFRIRRADGVYRWFKTRAVPIRDTQGKIVKWYGSNTDIDDLKQAEKELNEHREHLEVLVKERTAELEQKNAELERFNKLFVGRELRMAELKKMIADLEKELASLTGAALLSEKGTANSK